MVSVPIHTLTLPAVKCTLKRSCVSGRRVLSLNAAPDTLEWHAPGAGLSLLLLCAPQVTTYLYFILLLSFFLFINISKTLVFGSANTSGCMVDGLWQLIEYYYSLPVCPDNTTECQYGRVDGQQPPCISNDRLCDGTADCNGGDDELDYNCPCSMGAVRLVGSIAPHEGRVEFCTNGRWSTLCSGGFSSPDISVVCHQLGYSTPGICI